MIALLLDLDQRSELLGIGFAERIEVRVQVADVPVGPKKAVHPALPIGRIVLVQAPDAVRDLG